MTVMWIAEWRYFRLHFVRAEGKLTANMFRAVTKERVTGFDDGFYVNSFRRNDPRLHDSCDKAISYLADQIRAEKANHEKEAAACQSHLEWLLGKGERNLADFVAPAPK